MSSKWLHCQLLTVVMCVLGSATMLFGQQEADDAPAGSDASAAAEAEGAASDDQEKPAKDDEEKKPAKDKDDEEKPSDGAPKAEAPETPASEPAGADVDPAEAQAAFQAKLEEWKGVLKSLRALTPRYSVATEEEAVGIRQEWEDLIAKGESLIPQLRSTGRAAYAATGGADREVERFLTKLLEDDVNHDRYEPAYELGSAMVTSGCEVEEVLDATGKAAFATNHFEEAESLLKRAENAGGLSETGSQYLSLIDEYKAYWEEEKAVRQAEAAANDLPRVKITTNRGEMVVELFENQAPDTVGNFVSLVEKEFYDGLTFHRVLPGFMAQGGCPQGDGSGGPGYMIKCETDVENRRNHFRGSLSMAHAGKDTGGSQFFLTFVPTPHLNGKHTAFGRVIEGMDVLAKLQRIDPSKPDLTVQPDKIVKMEVLRKRDHEYKPNKVQ